MAEHFYGPYARIYLADRYAKPFSDGDPTLAEIFATTFAGRDFRYVGDGAGFTIVLKGDPSLPAIAIEGAHNNWDPLATALADATGTRSLFVS